MNIDELADKLKLKLLEPSDLSEVSYFTSGGKSAWASLHNWVIQQTQHPHKALIIGDSLYKRLDYLEKRRLKRLSIQTRVSNRIITTYQNTLVLGWGCIPV